MALPWIIGGLAVATVAYLASDDDSSSSSSSSSDKDEREREVKRRAKEEKNTKILEEISNYKDSQSSRIEEKYGAIISFDIQEDLNKASKIQIIYQDKTQQYTINNLKKEVKELKEALKELEAIKNEILK